MPVVHRDPKARGRTVHIRHDNVCHLARKEPFNGPIAGVFHIHGDGVADAVPHVGGCSGEIREGGEPDTISDSWRNLHHLSLSRAGRDNEYRCNRQHSREAWGRHHVTHVPGGADLTPPRVGPAIQNAGKRTLGRPDRFMMIV